jgi:hypothetical protein
MDDGHLNSLNKMDERGPKTHSLLRGVERGDKMHENSHFNGFELVVNSIPMIEAHSRVFPWPNFPWPRE